MPRLIGYARVSKEKQKTDLQLDALTAVGCDRIFQDKISGKRTSRKGLDAALATLRTGDRLIVWRVDRLGRSLFQIVTTLETLRKKGCALQSLAESCDSVTPQGRVLCYFHGLVAEMEHGAILERTNAGVQAAAARGRYRGPRHKLTPTQRAEAQKMLGDGVRARTIASIFAVAPATIYRCLEREARSTERLI